MNPEIKEIWIEALKSGKYTQGTNYLQCNGKLCCLGVLCELAIENGIPLKKEVSLIEKDGMTHVVVKYNKFSEGLPEEVQEWSCISTEEGAFKYVIDGHYDYNYLHLSSVNDNSCDGKYTAVIPIIEEYF